MVFLSAFWLFLISFILVKNFASDIFMAKNYSDVYDQMVQTLEKTKGNNNVTITKLPKSDLIFSAQLEYDWVREAIANYYETGKINYK